MSLELVIQIASHIRSGSLSEIKRLLNPYTLNQRQFIMSADVRGSCLLYRAVSHASYSIVLYFLDECGADANSFGTKHGEKETCLLRAVNLNAMDIAEILIKRGATINPVLVRSVSPVAAACFHDNTELLELLVKNGANINVQNTYGNVLISSLYNVELFKYLIVNGGDVNFVDGEGFTPLMQALRARQKNVIDFLLTCDDINVRLKNWSDEDALNMAVKHCYSNTIQKIIKMGNYTKDEVIKVYELESCFCHIYQNYSKSNRLWKNALKLRGLPKNMPIFDNMLPDRNVNDVFNLFREKETPALLYIKSLYGPKHLLTVRAMANALCYVRDHQNFLQIYKSLSKILNSFKSREFLDISEYIQHFIKIYLFQFSADEAQLKNFFRIFRCYTFMLRAKQKQVTTPSLRRLYSVKLRNFAEFFIDLVSHLKIYYEDFNGRINNEIQKFTRTYLKNSTTKSILQMCFDRNNYHMFLTFLFGGADVNETNEDNETILPYILNSSITRRQELILLVSNVGFDFSLVTSTRYCLHCRMKKENLFDLPKECNTLQCLAANTICQKIVFAVTGLPPLLKTIIRMHLHIL